MVKEGQAIFKSRLLEILVFLVAGLIFVGLGRHAQDINYVIFFYLMAVMFFLAIFRPKMSS